MTTIWAAVIGAVAALLAAFLAAYLGARFARPARKLTIYREVQFPAVFAGPLSASPLLSITFDGKPVEAIYSTRAQITNTGKEVITDLPIKWHIDTDGDILTAAADGVPTELDRSHFDNATKEVDSFIAFINPGEKLSLSVYASQPIKGHRVEARAMGVLVDSFDWKEEGRRDLARVVRSVLIRFPFFIAVALLAVNFETLVRWFRS